MCKLNSIILLCLIISGCTFSKENHSLPQDIKAFAENADNCVHYSGEWDSTLSQERQREIEKSVDNYCGKAKVQQEVLKAKYHSDDEIVEILNRYDFS